MKAVMQIGMVAVLLAVMVPAMKDGSLIGALAGMGGNRSVTGAAAVDPSVPGAEGRRMVARAERQRTAPRGREGSKGTASLVADRRGHFLADATINKRSIKVLVDTGASSVAMSRATAKRLGVRVRRSDFVHTANTANGQVEMAVATLDRVRIGGVELRDVEAAVLPDGALDGVLLGMSFLGRLQSFRVESGRLVLVQ